MVRLTRFKSYITKPFKSTSTAVASSQSPAQTYRNPQRFRRTDDYEDDEHNSSQPSDLALKQPIMSTFESTLSSPNTSTLLSPPTNDSPTSTQSSVPFPFVLDLLLPPVSPIHPSPTTPTSSGNPTRNDDDDDTPTEKRHSAQIFTIQIDLTSPPPPASISTHTQSPPQPASPTPTPTPRSLLHRTRTHSRRFIAPRISKPSPPSAPLHRCSSPSPSPCSHSPPPRHRRPTVRGLLAPATTFPSAPSSATRPHQQQQQQPPRPNSFFGAGFDIPEAELERVVREVEEMSLRHKGLGVGGKRGSVVEIWGDGGGKEVRGKGTEGGVGVAYVML